MSTQELVDELVVARNEFMSAVGRADESSAREMIAHVGYWVGSAVEAIQAAEEGRASSFGTDRPPTDEVNESVARVARETDLGTVRKREAASFDVLVERLGRMDPSLLSATLPDGATLEQGLLEDGADHYREHAAELLA